MPKLSVFYLPPVIRVPIAKRPVNDPFLKFCFLGSILLPTLLGQIILDIQSEVEICNHELLENIYIKRRREVGLDRKIVFFFSVFAKQMQGIQLTQWWALEFRYLLRFVLFKSRVLGFCTHLLTCHLLSSVTGRLCNLKKGTTFGQETLRWELWGANTLGKWRNEYLTPKKTISVAYIASFTSRKGYIGMIFCHYYLTVLLMLFEFYTCAF